MNRENYIIEELRQIRSHLLEKHGGLEGLVRHLKEEGARSGHERVTLPPRLVERQRPTKKSA
jgi:hypothetical protein